MYNFLSGIKDFIVNMDPMLLAVAFIIIVLIVVIIVASVTKKNDTKLMQETPENRFKYLDTIFWFNMLDDQRGGRCYIIQDLTTQEIFGVSSLHSNVGRKKPAEFNSTGSYWVRSKLEESFIRDGNNIRFGKGKLAFPLKYDEEKFLFNKIGEPLRIYHINPEYDISLLDKVTLIDGVVKFDK